MLFRSETEGGARLPQLRSDADPAGPAVSRGGSGGRGRGRSAPASPVTRLGTWALRRAAGSAPLVALAKARLDPSAPAEESALGTRKVFIFPLALQCEPSLGAPGPPSPPTSVSGFWGDSGLLLVVK